LAPATVLRRRLRVPAHRPHRAGTLGRAARRLPDGCAGIPLPRGGLSMQHWLMKSEPETFSIADLARRPRRTEHWDGVRTYQARNYMREMRRGDQAYFYHSNCATPGIAGIVEIAREAYPDFTALDPESPYHDPRSTPEQ